MAMVKQKVRKKRKVLFINTMDIFENICRACNNQRSKLIPIFKDGESKSEAHILEMLRTFPDLFAVEKNDKLPQEICFLCVKQLETTYKFLKKWKNSQSEFEKVVNCVQQIDAIEEISEKGETIVITSNKANKADENSHTSNLKSPNKKLQPIKREHEPSGEANKNIFAKAPPQISKRPTKLPRSIGISTPTAPAKIEEIDRIKCDLCSNKSFLTSKALYFHKKIAHKLHLKENSK